MDVVAAHNESDLVGAFYLSDGVTPSLQSEVDVHLGALGAVGDLEDGDGNTIWPVAGGLQEHEIVHLSETVLSLSGHQIHL